jgi:hypothetical protein
MIICIFFFCAVALQAQNKGDSARMNNYKNTISVNGSVFLEKLFKSNLVPDLNNPFVYYMRDVGRFQARIGVNGWNSQKTTTNIKANEQTVTNNFFSSVSLGCYLKKDISKCFSIGYGLNLIGAYVDSSVSVITSVDEVKNYTFSKHYGIAPGALLKYKLNDRISFFAEYTIPIKMVSSQTGTTYSLFPEENTTNRRSSSFNFLFYNPLNIYVSCSF